MENLLVLKVPESYSSEEKKKLEQSVQSSIDEGGIIVIPEGAEIYSLPVAD